MSGGGLASDNPERMFFATVCCSGHDSSGSFPCDFFLPGSFFPVVFSWRFFRAVASLAVSLAALFLAIFPLAVLLLAAFFLAVFSLSVSPFRPCSDRLRHGAALALLRRATGWPGCNYYFSSFSLHPFFILSSFFPPSFPPSFLPPILSPSLPPSSLPSPVLTATGQRLRVAAGRRAGAGAAAADGAGRCGG